MAEQPTRVQILLKGAALTSGQRDAAYGDPIYNLTLAGELKKLVRLHQRRDMPAGEQEGWDQVLTKIARAYTGGFTEDNYVDAATYAAIAGEIAEFFNLQAKQAQAKADAEAARQDALVRPVAEALADDLIDGVATPRTEYTPR